MGKRKPINKQLYEKVKKEAKKKFDVWPSAYASAWLVQEYENRGGLYNKKFTGTSPLRKALRKQNKSPKKKSCSPDKIINPKTGRCVLKTGKIGLSILRKKCPSNKIVNPETGRCVLKTGKIGKSLLKTK